MSERDERLYLGDMLDTARKVHAWTENLEREAFDDDEPLRLALLHLVQIIGEAARHVSEEIRTAHPAIPWHKIVGMRHKLVHDYMHVNEDRLWDTVGIEIPKLIAKLEKIVPPEEE